MSWFSNPFARSSDPPQYNSDGEEEDDNVHGKGVKEDLSQLTQTFKKQLWGVASFLAPPSLAKFQDEADADDDDGAQSKASIAPRHDDHLARTDLSEELVDVDFDAFLDETLEDKPAEASKDEFHSKEHTQSSMHALVPHNSTHNVEHGLTGISRDLAELKGSVATGFSKILRAVREEIEHVESSKLYTDNTSEDEDDDNTGKFAKSTRAQRYQGINMYLGPLINNVVHNDKGKDLEKRAVSKSAASSDNGDDDGDEAIAIKDYDNAGPSDLHNTFIHGFRGISEFASSFISLSVISDNENKQSLQMVGITEEVLAFVRNISMHPETWLDFPLLLDDDIDDFEMSAAQKEHIHALEVASPGLSALKHELCRPDCMSESRFWEIYFILLHSRLSKMDALLLSTPKIIQARAQLAKKLQDDKEYEVCKKKAGYQIEEVKSNQNSHQTSGLLIDLAEEVQNKNVLASTVKLATASFEGAETDADRWLNEEPLSRVPCAASISRDKDDVSFSDLEEDDGQTIKDMGRSNSTQSFDWVQLNKTSSVENFDGQGPFVGDGAGQQFLPQSSSQVSRKPGQSESKSESSDWSTVEEDDATSSDSLLVLT